MQMKFLRFMYSVSNIHDEHRNTINDELVKILPK